MMSKWSGDSTISQLARNPYSLGIAAKYLSEIALFARFEFGPTMSSLMHQINDGTHLIVERNDHLCGYLGWVQTSQTCAEDWLENRGPLSKEAGGDAVVVTIFHAQENRDILRMIKVAKTMTPGLSVYWKRFFSNERAPSPRAVKVKRGASDSL
jgi:hypothetical protein